MPPNIPRAGLYLERDNQRTTGDYRRKNQTDTLGQAVPYSFKVSRGLDGSPADDIFPTRDSQFPVQKSVTKWDFVGLVVKH